MKSDFLIKKALPVILCAVLVISMILIGIAPSEALASETVVREEQVSFNDYEDAIQSVQASRIKAGFIVTRNIKDFDKSKVFTLEPKEFLEQMHNIMEA